MLGGDGILNIMIFTVKDDTNQNDIYNKFV